VTILVTAMMWATATCLLETKELVLALRLSESFLWADYHPSLLCSRMDQRSLLPKIISVSDKGGEESGVDYLTVEGYAMGRKIGLCNLLIIEEYSKL